MSYGILSLVGGAVSRDAGKAFVHLAFRHVALQVVGVAVAHGAAVHDARVVTPAAVLQRVARGLAVTESLVRRAAHLVRLRGALGAVFNVDFAWVVRHAIHFKRAGVIGCYARSHGRVVMVVVTR